MRVTVLATHPELAPSTRFRIDQFRPALAERGVHLEYAFLFDRKQYQAIRQASGALGKSTMLLRALRARRDFLAGLGDTDLIWILKEIAPALEGLFWGPLDALSTPIVYDFDDAVYLPKPGGNSLRGLLSSPHYQTAELCRRAHTVFAGNPYLAEFAGSHTERVRVIPTVIDTDRFVPAGDTQDDTPVIGWVGSHSTLPYLMEQAEAFRALAAKRSFKLRIVSNTRPPEIPGVDVEYIRWTPDQEVSVFHGLTMGVYPLSESPWSLGKCGFKAIEYLSCGVPCVASPVGVIRDIVVPEETGLWAQTTDEWVDAMTRLLDRPDEASAWGRQGRAHVIERFSIRSVLPDLLDGLRTAAQNQSLTGAASCAV